MREQDCLEDDHHARSSVVQMVEPARVDLLESNRQDHLGVDGVDRPEGSRDELLSKSKS